ncbi:MAG: hypothetical protein RL095_2812 [Verrucomicrobiota bacterium]|jgi:uncharacterized membrane protein
MSHLDIDFPGLYLTLGGLVLAGLAVMAWRNVSLAPKKGQQAALEALRFTAALLAFLSLADPVRVTVVEKNTQPVILVLKDTSRSMNTEDVQIDAKVLSRAAAADSLLSPEALKALGAKHQVVVEDFGSGDSRGTDLAGALASGLKRHGPASGGKEDLRAILLLSDGDWNSGKDPSDAAMAARTQGVPVFTVPCGAEKFQPDLILERVEAPGFGLVNEKIQIPFRVRNVSGREYRGRATLRSRQGVNLTRDLVLADGESASESFIWQPGFEGRFNFALEISGIPGEFRADNNRSEFSVPVRRELIKVLVVESTPRWEYRFLRNALMRDPGVQVSTLLLHQQGMKVGGGPGYLGSFPRTRDELSQYDVVFLGDVGAGAGGLGDEQIQSLRGLVEKLGSGLVLIPGLSGSQASLEKTALGDIMPIVYDSKRPGGNAYSTPSMLRLSALGEEHLLTYLADTGSNNSLWKSLPGFHWSAAVDRAKLGSQILASHASDKTPLLVTRPAGNGQVLFLGTDSAWRWRRGVEDLYHYRFWGQVVRWMASRRHSSSSEHCRLFLSPERPAQGDQVDVQATLFFGGGVPCSGAETQLRVIPPAGPEISQQMQEGEGGWGVYRTQFTPDQPGQWKVILTCPSNNITHELRFDVAGAELEKIGVPARPSVMKEISRISGGETLFLEGGAKTLAKLAAMPPPQPEELRWRLLNQIWWGLLIVGIFAAYWLLRKRFGLI